MDNLHNCRKCNLCLNHLPLLDELKSADIMFIGISSKIPKVDDEKPLSNTTKSGKLLNEILKDFLPLTYYRTNLVKCPPLDKDGKLRYPTSKEIGKCIDNIDIELDIVKPQIVFLLGGKVSEFISKKYSLYYDEYEDEGFEYAQYKNIYLVPIYHPSYISTYHLDWKNDYIDGVRNIIKILMK